MGWIVLLATLIVSSLLYYDASKRIPLIGGTPLAPAEPIPELEFGTVTNFAAAVSDLSGDHWNHERLSVEPNAGPSPDGMRSATRLGERFAAGLHRIETAISGVTPDEPHTLSLFVKPDGCAGVQFEMADHGAGKYGVARFDLLRKGLVAQIGDVTDSGLQLMPTGWFRCWMVMPFATDRAVFNFTLLNAKGEWRYLGNGVGGLFVWGVQLERGRRMSGYSRIGVAED
jgi:hypothetical protein